MRSNLAEVHRTTPDAAESATAETFSNHMGREGREREPETYPHGLMEKGVLCLFYEFGALLKDIRNSYNPMSNTSEMGVLSSV